MGAPGTTEGLWLLKATPWPWGFYPAMAYDVIVEEVCGDEGCEYESQIEIASINNAAVGGNDHHPSRSEAEANAHQLAASGALYDALVDLVDWLDSNQRTISGEFSMDDLLSDGRAAIAKARGEA